MHAHSRLAIGALLAGILTFGCVSSPVVRDTTVRMTLLSPKEVKLNYGAMDYPNPFVSPGPSFTTMPLNFLTAVVTVPAGIGNVTIDDLVVFDTLGKAKASAASRDDMIGFWNQLDYDSYTTRKQLSAINRNYLPAKELSGRLLGHDYVLVVLSKTAFEAGDRAELTLDVNGSPMTLDAEVGSVVEH